ncbi:helix-turn-helix domain-containing protein [Acidisoma sp. 7E03]
MGLVLMNERELHRVGVLAEIRSGDRTVASGAALLGLTAQHVRRLVERYAQSGASGLVHGARGRPSNRRRAAAEREQVLALLQAHYLATARHWHRRRSRRVMGSMCRARRSAIGCGKPVCG